MIKSILAVGLGGFVGSVGRFLITKYLGWLETAIPMGTFVSNMLGCLIMGIIFGLIERGGIAIGPDTKLFLTVGVCGGLTTFSTFMNENLRMVGQADYLTAALYAGLSLSAGLLMIVAGKWLATSF